METEWRAVVKHRMTLALISTQDSFAKKYIAYCVCKRLVSRPTTTALKHVATCVLLYCRHSLSLQVSQYLNIKSCLYTFFRCVWVYAFDALSLSLWPYICSGKVCMAFESSMPYFFHNVNEIYTLLQMLIVLGIGLRLKMFAHTTTAALFLSLCVCRCYTCMDCWDLMK